MEDVQAPQDDTTKQTDSSLEIHKRGHKKRSKGRPMRQKRPRPDYQPFIKDNENLRKFYKEQPLFDNEEEYEQFIKGLHETLPASFRINTFDYGQALFLRRLIENEEFKDFLKPDETEVSTLTADIENGKDPNLLVEEENGEEIDEVVQKDEKVSECATESKSVETKLEPLSWYPNRFAWQMNITRLDLRKSPILQQLHKFIMAETDNGFISRQEAVSMIPPLVLDVRRNHNVLDMCAAPGSKTAQLLEYLKHDIMSSSDKDERPIDGVFDDGMVVANDVDNKRCYMLVHQSNRLNSPNCIIINDDASRLPAMKTFNKEGEPLSDLKFDRILCDVPCSGDGTIRKNPDVWKKWSVGNTNNFHGIQLKILRRGIELLKKDGLLVYSTCSMSPIEDEAVIASLLRACEGSVQLESFIDRLPGLKFKHGISKWTLVNRDMETVPNFEQIPKENATQLFQSQFPPSEEESKRFELNKCVRVLPHLQNTGGFFVALLRKTTDNLPWEKQSQTDDECKPESIAKVKPISTNPKKRRFTGFREDPFFFVEENDPDWVGIRDVYGLDSNFPFNQLVYRCNEGKKRSIYLISKRIRNFIIANREEKDKPDFVKLINGGMRLFSRADTEAGFRICQDGVNEVLAYIKQDFKVPIIKQDLVLLLKTRAVPFSSLSSCEHIQNRIKQGSFILIYNYNIEVETRTQSHSMPLVAWKGEKTVSLYVSNTYRVHLCAITQIKTELCKSL